jgi:hypothetical protein
MKTTLLILAAVLSLSACGVVDRNISAITGGGTQTCVDGVLYLQFTSGVTVKYMPDGKVATCK